MYWRCTRSCLVLLCALSLQGCTFVDPPTHSTGFWQSARNYFNTYQFFIPGEPANKAILNSCSNPDISAALRCGGHGQCRTWSDGVTGEISGPRQVAFCECSRDWADPECRTPRKSQATAFFLSLFFGMFGADQFYLGFYGSGFTKMVSLGGFGLWYLYDLCRIGSSPVATYNHFKLAADLPRYIFVLSSCTMFLAIGFILAIKSIEHQRCIKKHEFAQTTMRFKIEDDACDAGPIGSCKFAPAPTLSPLKPKLGRFFGYGAAGLGDATPQFVPGAPARMPAGPMPTSSGLVSHDLQAAQAPPTLFRPAASMVRTWQRAPAFV